MIAEIFLNLILAAVPAAALYFGYKFELHSAHDMTAEPLSDFAHRMQLASATPQTITRMSNPTVKDTHYIHALTAESFLDEVDHFPHKISVHFEPGHHIRVTLQFPVNAALPADWVSVTGYLNALEAHPVCTSDTLSWDYIRVARKDADEAEQSRQHALFTILSNLQKTAIK